MDFQEMMKKKKLLKENAIKHVTAGQFKKDERFWELSTDKSGNGSALIRFLPQKDFEKNPVVVRMRHNFKLKGKRFFEYCPKTISWDEECPVCDELNPLYDDYIDTPKGKKYKHQAQIDLLKRMKEHIINILVIDDSANPENNGKVFLFRMNGIIHELYTKAINPPAEIIEPKIVYDYDEGCNFQYICIAPTKKGDYNDYRQSKFMDSSAIPMEKQEGIWTASYDLSEFTEEKLFKSYDDLNKKFRAFYFNEAQPKEIPGAGMKDIDNPFEDDNKTESEEKETDIDDSGFEMKPSEDTPNDNDVSNNTDNESDNDFKF